MQITTKPSESGHDVQVTRCVNVRVVTQLAVSHSTLLLAQSLELPEYCEEKELNAIKESLDPSALVVRVPLDSVLLQYEATN